MFALEFENQNVEGRQTHQSNTRVSYTQPAPKKTTYIIRFKHTDTIFKAYVFVYLLIYFISLSYGHVL